jgi:hypothetical protein
MPPQQGDSLLDLLGEMDDLGAHGHSPLLLSGAPTGGRQ